MFVASESGGLFATTDGGITWRHVDALPNPAPTDVAYAPSNPTTVIATAQANFRTANDGVIWRSTDEGNTWSQPSGSVPPAGPRCRTHASGWAVSFEPASNNVYVGTDCGLAVSHDGGVTWTHLVPDPAVPVNPDTTQNRVWSVLAQTGGRINLAAQDGLWYSTNGGAKWSKAVSGPGGTGFTSHALASSPDSSSHIFLAWPGWIAGSLVYQLWLTTDGGAHWTQLSGAPSGWSRGPFVRTARLSAVQPGQFTVYYGIGESGIVSQTFREGSTGPTGTGTWTALAVDHGDANDAGFDQSHPYPVLVATDGGVHQPVATVNLKAGNGEYVSAQYGGGGVVNANGPWVGTWESLVLVNTSGGTFSSGSAINLRTLNGHYLVAENGGGGAIGADRTAAGPWETFIITRIAGPGPINSGDQVALQAHNGQYVSAAGGGGAGVTADRNQIGPWETFTLGFNQAWLLAGSGPGGYDALQMTEVTGQRVQLFSWSPWFFAHTDYYYGTQDNDLVASPDGGVTWPTHICCEGYGLRTEPMSVNHASATVTGNCTGGCGYFVTDAHFANQRVWPSALGLTFPQAWTPYLLLGDPRRFQPGAYIQNTITTAATNAYMVTTNGGASWATAFTISLDLKDAPIVAGPSSDPTVYYALRRPGATTGQDRIGLVKARGFLTPGAGVVSDADVSGFGSLGMFPTMFAWYAVFGVDPENPDHLLAPDIETNEMKYSQDGGQTWQVDGALTSLVTGNGTYDFREGQFPLVHVVAFDPYNSCHILVGMAQNGILRSADGGNTWAKVPGSDVITSVSSLYFPPRGRIVVSTYGRGLWRLRLDRRARGCQFFGLRRKGQAAGPAVVDPSTGARVSFRDVGDPRVCPACQYLIVKNGRITDLSLAGPRVRQVVISGGSIHQVDVGKREVTLRIPNAYRSAIGGFGENKVLLSLVHEGVPIRGLVVDGDTLKAVIVSDGELPYQPRRIPYVRVLGAGIPSGVATAQPGDTITVSGEGFAPSARGENPVQVRLGDEVVARNVPVDSLGQFKIAVVVNRLPGVYSVVVEQHEGNRTAMDRTTVNVTTGRRARAR